MDKNLLLAKTINGLCKKLVENYEKGEYKEARFYGLAILMCIEKMDKEFVESSKTLRKFKIDIETLLQNINYLIGV